jgi:serine protease Do
VTVETLTSDMANQLKVSPQTKGVVVNEVSPSSKAAAAELQQGDVIVQVNHQPVTNTSDFRKAVSSVSNGPVLLLVNRGGNTRFIAVS